MYAVPICGTVLRGAIVGGVVKLDPFLNPVMASTRACQTCRTLYPKRLLAMISQGCNPQRARELKRELACFMQTKGPTT